MSCGQAATHDREMEEWEEKYHAALSKIRPVKIQELFEKVSTVERQFRNGSLGDLAGSIEELSAFACKINPIIR